MRGLTSSFSGASQPDELTALRAGVRHAQVTDERDESAHAVIRARGTNRRRRRIDRRHAQQAAGGRTRNGGGARVVPRNARLAVVSGVPTEQTVVQISAECRWKSLWRRMVTYGIGDGKAGPRMPPAQRVIIWIRPVRKWRNWQTRRT